MSETARDRAKAERYKTLLREAARLFAQHGYAGVSLEELGSAVGFSGPAVYRHVKSKQALLGALLVGESQRLLDGGVAVAQKHPLGLGRMRALIDYHVRFALKNPDLIRVHDRDVPKLSADDAATVRRLQRDYVAVWVEALGALRDEPADDLRLRVQAVFGLINSTPHSTTKAARGKTSTGRVLAAMAEAGLLA